MKRYLITGGAGFIGSHLVDLLLSKEHHVTVIDDLSTGNKNNLSKHVKNFRFNFVHGNILDKELIHTEVEKADRVFHLAAAVGVDLILKDTLGSLKTNILGSDIVLESCNKFRKRTLITSTSEVYGKNISDELDENMDRILGSPLVSRWSYSESKAIEEVIAHSYYSNTGLETIIVRLFNTVGPRQSGEYGMVIPRFVNQALSNNPINVFGDGLQKRCFCHVYDIVDALTSLIETDSAVGDVFNLGSQSEISILDLANFVKSILNSTSEIELIPYDKAYTSGFEDMLRRRPNISKISSLIGWQPNRNLTDIVLDVANFLKSEKIN
jgi:UDP-glucose 4-epimerase